jgi:hypothetical protein
MFPLSRFLGISNKLKFDAESSALTYAPDWNISRRMLVAVRSVDAERVAKNDEVGTGPELGERRRGRVLAQNCGRKISQTSRRFATLGAAVNVSASSIAYEKSRSKRQEKAGLRDRHGGWEPDGGQPIDTSKVANDGVLMAPQVSAPRVRRD